LLQQDFPVQLSVSGELPLGYKKGAPLVNPQWVTVSGPKSAVKRVSQAHVALDISGSVETIQRDIPVEILDANGDPVPDLTVSPRVVTVTQPISLLGGFKNVAVKVVTEGQVAPGYRLTNILVSPPTVTLFSDNPKLMNEIPGFVETLPVDLTNLDDDIEISVNLNLPEGITSVRDPVVLVQVSVAAIEGSLTLSVPVETIGLSPDLQAIISPVLVDVIVAGPLNVLDTLTPSSFRVVLDLTGLPLGVYQRVPIVEAEVDQVRVQTTLPETVEVSIELAPTPTPTFTLSVTPEAPLTPPADLTPTQTLTATPQP
jgi:YbbR domain-containing protein